MSGLNMCFTRVFVHICLTTIRLRTRLQRLESKMPIRLFYGSHEKYNYYDNDARRFQSTVIYQVCTYEWSYWVYI